MIKWRKVASNLQVGVDVLDVRLEADYPGGW